MEGQNSDLLQELINRCKGSLYLTVSEHRNLYMTVEQWLRDSGLEAEVAPEMLQRMIETNTVIDLHFYPNTAIGFHRILHYSLHTALMHALWLIDGERSGSRENSLQIGLETP